MGDGSAGFDGGRGRAWWCPSTSQHTTIAIPHHLPRVLLSLSYFVQHNTTARQNARC